MKVKLILYVVVVLAWGITCKAFERGEANLQIRVVDETGTPVAGAHVFGGAWWPDREKVALGNLFKENSFDRKTDINGVVNVRLAVYVDMRVTVDKDGHYLSREVFHFQMPGEHRMTLDSATKHWLPWPAKKTIVLKRVRNPIPMYVKAVDVKVPVMGQNAGYDLTKGDWVSPYGKGIVPDLLICVTGTFSKVEGQFGGFRPVCDLSMHVTFSNSGDGIQTILVPMHNDDYQGSLLVTDHEAPLDGYRNEYTYQQRIRLNQIDNINAHERLSQIAYFRVRTELDETGKIKKAWYGTMRRDLWAHFKMDGSVWVSFRYDLNPDGTRNVERAKGVNLLR